MSFQLVRRVFTFSFFFLLSFFSVPPISWAQSSNGTLVGAVTDPTGAAVVGAHISVVSVQYGVPHDATTDAVGTYRIEGLQPGTYAVTFTATGFQVLQVGQVAIQGSVTTTVNGALQLGATTTSVMVEAGANQIIDTQSGELSESIGQNEVDNLPNSSFNAAQLALTLPGVQDTPGVLGNGAVNAYLTNGISFSVNGTRPRANNFLIDGQDDNDNSISGQAYQPDNLGLISEVSVLMNAYSSQYGRGGGSVTNYITKGGGNSYHGSAWEVNQDSAFASNDAEDKLAGISRPLYIENTYGLELGGPILRDRLFFYGTAQWNPTRQRGTGAFAAIPDSNGVATLTTLAQTNPQAKIFLESLGSLVAPGSHACGDKSTPAAAAASADDEQPGPGYPCIEMSNYARNAVPIVGVDDNWNFRMDWHPTENDLITGSYLHSYSSLSPDFFANNGALGPFDSYQGGPSSIFRSHWSHTFSPVLLNELRFSYTSIDFTFGFLPSSLSNSLSTLPYIEFPSINVPNIGLNSEFPQGRGHKTYQVQEMVTRSVGSHTFTAGIDFSATNAKEVLALNTRGTVIFESSALSSGFDPFGSFLNDDTGVSGSISRGFGNPNLAPTIKMYAPYIQDTWRARANLTLSLGLRYEYWGTPQNILTYPAISPTWGIDAAGNFNIASATLSQYPSIFGAKQKADKDNFAPRISFAYTPHWGKRLFGEDATVLRGGYGVFYDGLFMNIPDNGGEAPPNALGGTITGGGLLGQPKALESVSGVTATQDPSATVETIPSDLVNPVTQQWNLDMQRSLPGNFVLTTSYVGTRGTHLFANQDWNPTVSYGPRVNSNFGELVVRSNAGQSWYNAGELELERKVNTSLTLRASYTYSKFLDDSSEILTTTGLTSYAQQLDCQKCDWGPSTFDRAHRFVVAYIYDMPYAKGNLITRALTDQWQWSGIATFETGTPNTVSDGFDNIGNGHPGSRPNLSNPHQPISAIGIDSVQITGVENGTDYALTQGCLNTGNCTVEPASDFRFIIPASGPGDLGRNSVYGPGQIYFDTGIQRDFPFHFHGVEHQSIMFRTEFFNAFNHPNLYTPSLSMISGAYGDTAITIEGQRIIKFWLKYSF
ncbi:MAG TPA: TonB-dependent receptor [Candidatus Acidoferrales bacterium]